MLHVRRVQRPRSLSSDWPCGLYTTNCPLFWYSEEEFSLIFMFCVFICSYMINRDEFGWISRDGSFMIRAFPSGIITGIINLDTALDSLAHYVQSALVILPGLLGLMAERSSNTRNEAVGKGGSPKRLWSIHTQFCVCAALQARLNLKLSSEQVQFLFFFGRILTEESE